MLRTVPGACYFAPMQYRLLKLRRKICPWLMAGEA